MRDDDHRAAVVLQLADDLQHFAGQFRVERGRRFVEAEDVRGKRKRTGDRDALALTAGKLERIAVHLVRQTDLVQQFLRVGLDFVRDPFFVRYRRLFALFRFELVQFEHFRCQRDVPQNVVLREQVERLEHQSEMQPVLTDFRVRHLFSAACLIDHLSADGNGAFVRLFEEVQTAEQGGLAAAGGADDDQNVALIQRKVDPAQNFVAAEALTDVFYFKYRIHSLLQFDFFAGNPF